MVSAVRKRRPLRRDIDWVKKELKKINNNLIPLGKYSGSKAEMKFRCSCGKEFKTKIESAVRGLTRSCGCSKKSKFIGEMSGSYLSRLRYNPKTRGLNFNLKPKYLWDLFLKQDRKCALSGIGLTFTQDYKNEKDKQTASLDRIDSSKDYTEGNVQWIHKDVNKMKMNFTDKKLVEWCRVIASFNKDK